jgi:hypothetical protein
MNNTGEELLILSTYGDVPHQIHPAPGGRNMSRKKKRWP